MSPIINHLNHCYSMRHGEKEILKQLKVCDHFVSLRDLVTIDVEFDLENIYSLQVLTLIKVGWTVIVTLGTSLLAGTEPPALLAPSLMMSQKTFSLGGQYFWYLTPMHLQMFKSIQR